MTRAKRSVSQPPHHLQRTAEQGARQLVWAALGPDGKEGKHAYFLKGAYVSTLSVKEPSDFAMSKEGKEAQDRIRVSVGGFNLNYDIPDIDLASQEETIEVLSKISPEVNACVAEYLTARL